MTLLLITTQQMKNPYRTRYGKEQCYPIPIGSIVKFVGTTIEAHTLDCYYHNKKPLRYNIGPCRLITIEFEKKEYPTHVCMEDAVLHFIEYSF
jgi:hypothetical protein